MVKSLLNPGYVLFKQGSPNSQITTNPSRTLSLAKSAELRASTIVLMYRAHRKPSTVPSAKIPPTHTSDSIKKEMASTTYASSAVVYSAATLPPVNRAIAATDTLSSSTSELLKIM